jgi:hypothetical protein
MSTGYKSAKEFERNQKFHEFARGVQARLRNKEVVTLKEWASGNIITLAGIDCQIDWQIQAREWLEADPPQRTRWEALKDYVEVDATESHGAMTEDLNLPSDALGLLAKAEKGEIDAIKSLMDRYLPKATEPTAPASKGRAKAAVEDAKQ